MEKFKNDQLQKGQQQSSTTNKAGEERPTLPDIYLPNSKTTTFDQVASTALRHSPRRPVGTFGSASPSPESSPTPETTPAGPPTTLYNDLDEVVAPGTEPEPPGQPPVYSSKRDSASPAPFRTPSPTIRRYETDSWL